MKIIKVPRLSANEDAVKLAEICQAENAFCKAGSVVCVLESTKITDYIETEEDGYVYFLAKEGDTVSTGQNLAVVDSKPLNPAAVATLAVEKGQDASLIVTKKAEALLSKLGLHAAQIKSAGVLTSSDVQAYASGQSDGGLGEVNPAGYEELEHIMADSDPGGATWADVSKLKQTLCLAESVYAQRWNRHLPVLDVLFDRWEAGKRNGFGEKSNISHLAYIIGDVRVGRQTYIGPFTYIDGSGSLEIGDYCSIAAGVHIYSHDTIARALSGYRAPTTRAPTKIGNSCFIGPGAIITKGVTVGDHVMIAANAVVTGDVPSYAFVRGNPAVRVGRVVVASDGSVRIEAMEGKDAER